VPRWPSLLSGAIVLAGGEAGVGKSRLIEEFCTRARDAGAVVAVGLCTPAEVGGDLRTYAQATIVAPGGKGRDENEGFDAFLPLIDSGISLYVWRVSRFLACVVFTCKSFDADRALTFVNEFFATTDSTSLAF
jgi:S-adenosylmethionine decarboxylase